MNKLAEAIVTATLSHGDAKDKSGNLYILHPIAVMLDPSLTTEDEKIVAILHDTLEDTELTEKEILDKFGLYILDGVKSVSRQYRHKITFEIVYKEPKPEILHEYERETYTEFIHRARKHPVGRKVKKADIFHNMSPERINQLPVKMRDISKRYKKGLLQLGVSEEEITAFLEGK